MQVGSEPGYKVPPVSGIKVGMMLKMLLPHLEK